MTAMAPENWDLPIQMIADPFTYFLLDEVSIFRLREMGMPEDEIREIRQDQDEHRMEWHVALMQFARTTGYEPPELFGWGDENFYSTTQPRETA